MLLTLSLTQPPATDLGFLLHKHPGRLQTFALSFGQAHVFYPETQLDRCTAALLLEIDPVGLVRGHKDSTQPDHLLDQYVNDRPYVASSFLSVALAQVFGSALGGKSAARPDLAAQELPFEASLAVVRSRGGEAFLRRLFEPLGYTVQVHRHLLDDTFPEWGESQYLSITLAATCRLRDLLTHLYVLLPVLDDEKHYWIGEDEVEKLVRHAGTWLSSHPERDVIARRYLKHRRSLVRSALKRLVDEEDPDQNEEEHAHAEAAIEGRLSLHEQRIGAVSAALKQSGAQRVLDLGCGEGRLLQVLLKTPQYTDIVGMDVSYRSLERAQERLLLDRLPANQRARIKLIQGSLIYRDKRLAGYDAAAVMEVIEHLDPARLAAFERVLFEFARPGMIALTTPNREYNILFESLPAGSFRHRDHRFEWTRAEFHNWATAVADRFGYRVRFLPIGPEDPNYGPPTQMAVLTQRGSHPEVSASTTGTVQLNAPDAMPNATESEPAR